MATRQVAARFILAIVLSLPGLAQANAGTAATRPNPPPADGQQPTANANQQSARQAPSEDNPLNLTEDQKAKLGPILVEEHQQLDALRADSSLSQDEKIQKANDIRSNMGLKIKAILTPEQIQKLSELNQQKNEKSPNPSPLPASSDNPQK